MKNILTFLVAFMVIMELQAQEKSVLNKCTVHLQVSGQNNNSIQGKREDRLFNFNPVITPTSLTNKDVIFKNSIADESSIFLVFSSVNDSENTIMNVSSGHSKIVFSNQKVRKDKDFDYKDVNSKNGIILSYIFNLESSKRNNYISFKEYFEDGDTTKSELLEMLYFPTFLNNIERSEIETFLSIKYGISLIGKVDYINSKEIKIWDSKKNELFNNRVTGIGRDDDFDLYQIKSYNSTKDGVVIGLDSINKQNLLQNGKFNDLNFVTWGDNSSPAEFKKSANHQVDNIDRIWQVQTTKKLTDTILNQIIVYPKTLFNNYEISDNEVLWLVMQNSLEDSVTIRYIKQTINTGSSYVFDKVNFDNSNSGLGYFSFIKAPDFFAIHTIDKTDCKCLDFGNLKLQMIGGVGPYHITLVNNNFESDTSCIENTYINKRIPAGNYKLIIIDANNNSFTDDINIEKEKGLDADFIKYRSLSNSGTVKIASDNIPGTNDLRYEWLFNNELVAVDRTYLAKEAGDYTLRITNNNGCTKEYTFVVINELFNNEEINIYPNPALRSKRFSIKIDLKEKSNVVIVINDANGKMVKMRKFDNIIHHEYTDQLFIPGTYIVNIKLKDNNYTTKLIVI